MVDIEQTFGINFTVIQNLTGEAHFLAWFPAQSGHGRTINARECIRFAGNLFEVIAGTPTLMSKLRSDISSGKIAVSLCGNPTESDYMESEVLDTQTFALDCLTRIWDSSSSAAVVFRG